MARAARLAHSLLTAAAVGLASPSAAQPEVDPILQADANGDGLLQRAEAPIDLLPQFTGLDLNGDGALDSFELYDYRARQRRQFEAREPRPSPGGAGRKAQPKAQTITSAEQLVEVLDKNADGFVTLEEAPRSRHDLLLRMDANGDRRVSLDEARQVDRHGLGSGGPSSPSKRSMERTVTLMDTDGNGRLERKEAPLAIQRDFDRYDTNGDGAIDAREARAADAAR